LLYLSGPGGAVLNAFDQHLKNKQKWGVAADNYETIIDRVAKHGAKDQPLPDLPGAAAKKQPGTQ
jgi:hypothetical protein